MTCMLETSYAILPGIARKGSVIGGRLCMKLEVSIFAKRLGVHFTKLANRLRANLWANLDESSALCPHRVKVNMMLKRLIISVNCDT